MARLIWDQEGQRFYETGVDRGVLYPKGASGYASGVAWNGLTGFTQSPSGAEASPLYADNIKYLNLIAAEEFGGTIEAYTSPDEFAECDGTKEIAPGVTISQQIRKTFGVCYRTKLGNDTLGDDYGYKLHLVYGAKATPSERAYATVNESPEAMPLSWEFSTTPVSVSGGKPTAHLCIDSTKVDATKLAALEAILYGTNASAVGVTPAVSAVEPRLPLPNEVATLLAADD